MVAKPTQGAAEVSKIRSLALVRWKELQEKDILETMVNDECNYDQLSSLKQDTKYFKVNESSNRR
jgi:hypothetical protein